MNSSPNRQLAVELYNGTQLSNWIDADPSPEAVAQARFSLVRSGFLSGPSVTLTPPTGRFNCHGLTFASRRTCVPRVGDPVTVDAWLAQDEYVRVRSPQVGDIVLYRGHRAPGTDPPEVEHSAIVTVVSDLGSVRVRSKWGVLEEVEHLVHDGPYGDLVIEYWRLRRA